MAGNETGSEESTGTSRRALLGKAAAAGAIVYTVPMIKSIPAYAADGFDSYRVSSKTCCVWFSPNQNDPQGRWHSDTISPATDIVGPKSDSGTSNPATLTVQVEVDGTNRAVTFTGNPNNDPGNLGRGVAGETPKFWGGGASITSEDSECEILIEGVYCNPQNDKNGCDPRNTKAAPAPWDEGSNDDPIDQEDAPGGCTAGDHFTGTVYYHTGRTGHGDGDRCKLGILFKVRCK